MGSCPNVYMCQMGSVLLGPRFLVVLEVEFTSQGMWLLFD